MADLEPEKGTPMDDDVCALFWQCGCGGEFTTTYSPAALFDMIGIHFASKHPDHALPASLSVTLTRPGVEL